MTRQGFLVLTGEAGTGKTFPLNQILDWLRQRNLSSAYIFHTHLEPIGLFRFILSDFGVPCQSKSKSDLVNALHTWLLQRHAAGDLPVLILDEAQALPSQTLDELRLLLNLETSTYWRMHRSHSAVAVFVRSALSPWPLPLRNLVLWLRGPTKRSAAHRNILAVVTNWLREPITPGNIFSNR